MALVSRKHDVTDTRTTFSGGKSGGEPGSLSALLRQGDLALLAILAIIVVPEIRGMQLAGGAVFFYWFAAFLTFQIPSLVVFSWLARQAPAHVPLYVWIVRLLDERWRSVLLFFSWWSGVLIVLPAIGICLDLLQTFFPSWFSSTLAQCMAFLVLLAFATLFASLPVRLFRIILWAGGLCYLAAFALLGIAVLVLLIRAQSITSALPHPALTILPAHFSWSLFGLAVLCQIGVNAPLFLD